MSDDRNPRWTKWRLMPEVRAWEAISLSLNIEPEKIQTDDWMGGNHHFDEGDEFNDRLTVLQANLSNRDYFPTPCMISLETSYKHGVRLDEFAAWCVRVGFDIPPKLAELANNAPQASATSPAPAAKVEAVETTAKPWDISNPSDPAPEQSWYTPARYFARQLVKDDSTLLTKRKLLATKVSQSLSNVGINKRGGKKPIADTTILKALSNVSLG